MGCSLCDNPTVKYWNAESNDGEKFRACEDCGTVCEMCGREILEWEKNQDENRAVICYACWAEMPECPSCKRKFHEDDTYEWKKPKNGHPVCDDCYEGLKWEAVNRKIKARKEEADE